MNTLNFTWAEHEKFCDTPEKVQFVKNFIKEYKLVRPYFCEDFYPLTQWSDRSDVWCASQYNRKEKGDGIIEVFKRENSPYSDAQIKLFDLNPKKKYTFIDLDDNSEFYALGKDLMEKGLSLHIEGTKIAKIYLYK